jgi:hypothetical protein
VAVTLRVLFTSGRLRLLLASLAFAGWLSWLGVTALTKSRAPIISRAQASVATVPVRARVTTALNDTRPAPLVSVVEQLTPAGPPAGASIHIRNLPLCTGYTGDGEYLLLLIRDADAPSDKHPEYFLEGYPRSPGSRESAGSIAPIYPWTEKTDPELRAQLRRLFP